MLACDLKRRMISKNELMTTTLIQLLYGLSNCKSKTNNYKNIDPAKKCLTKS